MQRPPLTSIAEDKKTSTRYRKLLQRTKVSFKVLDVKIHDISIDENGIQITISIDGAMSMLTKNLMARTVPLNLSQYTRTAISNNKDSECKETPQYVAV